MKKSIIFLMMLIAATTASAQDLVDRVSKAVGVELPSEYKQKVKDFVATNKVMKDEDAAQFTEQFILEEMKKDWGISKQNQLLFIWHKIYEGISQVKLYKLLDDSDMDRRSEYKKSLRLIANCYDEYKKGFKAYMEAGIAEADRRSAEADRRSAEADRRSAEADRRSAEATQSGLKDLVVIYNLYKNNPLIIRQGELEEAKKHAKWIFPSCKELNIDYKAILRKELGNEQKVKDLLKFYGIE